MEEDLDPLEKEENRIQGRIRRLQGYYEGIYDVIQNQEYKPYIEKNEKEIEDILELINEGEDDTNKLIIIPGDVVGSKFLGVLSERIQKKIEKYEKELKEIQEKIKYSKKTEKEKMEAIEKQEQEKLKKQKEMLKEKLESKDDLVEENQNDIQNVEVEKEPEKMVEETVFKEITKHDKDILRIIKEKKRLKKEKEHRYEARKEKRSKRILKGHGFTDIKKDIFVKEIMKEMNQRNGNQIKKGMSEKEDDIERITIQEEEGEDEVEVKNIEKKRVCNGLMYEPDEISDEVREQIYNKIKNQKTFSEDDKCLLVGIIYHKLYKGEKLDEDQQGIFNVILEELKKNRKSNNVTPITKQFMKLIGKWNFKEQIKEIKESMNYMANLKGLSQANLNYIKDLLERVTLDAIDPVEEELIYYLIDYMMFTTGLNQKGQRNYDNLDTELYDMMKKIIEIPKYMNFIKQRKEGRK